MSAILYPQPRVIARRRGDVPASGAERARFDRLALQLIGFISISILTYAGASLAGNILLESARNEAIQASARTRIARMEVASLRQRVDEMTSMRAVQDYASVRGFVAIDGSPHIPLPEVEGRRVAQLGNR
jgi:hypothetical protein